MKCPALAIYADPHDMTASFNGDPKGLAAAEADDLAGTSAQADAFQTGVPQEQARVVRIASRSLHLQIT